MEANPDEPHGAAVVADGFGLKGPRGWVFREVGLRAEPGSLVAIEGPSGSGRTCLLLALTGRMKAHEGHAEVAGLRLPRRMAAVRRISALGPVPGVSDLDPALTVDEHLRERALLQRRYDGSVRALVRRPAERAAATRARIDEALAAAGLDRDALPKAGRTSVRDLERLEALRLSVALALIGRPRVLALDDTDLKLSDADRAEAWALLRSVADAGTTVLAVCSEAPEGALRITTTAGDGAPADAGEEPTGTRAEDADEADGDEPREAEADSSAPGGDEDRPGADGGAGDTRSARETPAARATDDTDDTENTGNTTEEGESDAFAETGRS
ncbi:ATP-binding cassette domain-containing protein [Streptomyces sp. ms191]|uniref:ATP-binding cassette domain-containing protein n=1 Tax=Streptomyces sp. ms191 TaxID=1827978 RepID=UPI0011CDE609|nr:ATP-binding cassette domain-containing protein [Streptomyces sp. ms191]TXS29318.1 ATP-binding cassette domain-containing protein [Streptomyces sp. ms191]